MTDMTFTSPLERIDPPDTRHVTTIEQWWFVQCVAGLKEPYAYYDGVTGE